MSNNFRNRSLSLGSIQPEINDSKGRFFRITSYNVCYTKLLRTNQSGIAKGITTENEVSDVNNYIVKTLKEHDVVIYDIFYCPHKTEDNCECKKPKTYFIHKAHQLYNIDLSRSFIIGDHPSDIQCGLNTGITPIYLLTGHGQKHQNEISQEIVICSNLLEASKSYNFV